MRLAAILALVMLLLPQTAGAEGVSEAIEQLQLDTWQAALDEADIRLDALGLVRELASGDPEAAAERLLALFTALIAGEGQALGAQLLAFVGPSLMWALNRQLTGDENGPGAAAGWVCCLAGAGVMLTAFSEYAALAGNTISRLGVLSGSVFPALSSLMSATGSPDTAGMLRPLAALGGGALTGVLEKTARVLCGSAAVLAAAGCLTGRIRLKGLFRLCCSAGNWIFGGITTSFLGLAAACGVMGPARDGLSVRAARYAVDNLLPVVGGDVADAMDAMISGALLVRRAAGVTGVVVMLAVCIRPVVRLALGMLACRLAAALTEPVADGPLRECVDQMGQAVQLLLVAVAVSASLFMSLTGVALTGS